MRVASWVFVLAAALGAVGVFLPGVELQLAGKSVSRRTQISLYTASRDRELVRKLVVAYHASSKRQLGGEVLRKVTPHVGGRVRSALDDARDAMDTLDTTSDEDVRTAGAIFTATLAALLALDGLMILLVFPELMRGSYRRVSLVAALVASVLAAAIAVALHIACRYALWQANDEVGRTTLVLAAGAYVIPIAALAGLGAAIALLARRGARTRAMVPGDGRRVSSA